MKNSANCYQTTKFDAAQSIGRLQQTLITMCSSKNVFFSIMVTKKSSHRFLTTLWL